MLIIDKYAYTNNLTKFNPMAKFLFAIGSLFISIAINNIYINLAIFIIMFMMTTVIARIPIKAYIKLYIVPVIFLLFSIIPILISIGKTNVFIYSVNIGKYYFGLNKETIYTALMTASRSIACISATYFLALTTPINQLIKIFKDLKVPNFIIELIILIYRFIFIFLEEIKEIYMAQEMRYGYYGTKNSFKSFGILIKSLFVGVFLSYEDMVIALESKLYDGEFKIG